MNCTQHPEATAVAFCRECGKPMCVECRRPALGSIYCDVHAPAAAAPPYVPPSLPAPTAAYDSPYTAPAAQPAPDESVHPVLALLLGLIPGVGAIYNAQYAKGLIHAVIFGLLVSTVANAHNDGASALLGIMIAAWEFYMCFEAYHTARKRRYGVVVDEFAQFDLRGGGGRIPAGAILLIGLGFILLLDTTGIISIDEFEKYWPAGLIFLGVYLLYTRLTPDHGRDGKDAEARR